MIHIGSLKRSLYTKTQTHNVPVHGANIGTGFVLATVSGATFSTDPLLATVGLTLAAALNGYSAYFITEAYNEHSIGYR